MPSQRPPSEVLGVPADADEETVERAYRERVKEAHPDHGGSTAEFQAVRAAYERLLAGDDGAPVDPDPPVTGDGDDAGEDESKPGVAATVTFLDYDVLADFGWTADDADLFEKAARADLAGTDFGEFDVERGESLLEAAENRGFAWPFACRGGACANCAILLHEGEVSMPTSHVLTDELHDRGFRLSCNAMPLTDDLQVVYNVKHMPELGDLLLPPRPFEQAYSGD